MRHQSHSIASRSLLPRSCLCSRRGISSRTRGAAPSIHPPSMAVTVARVHLAMAHAAMPGLLPTPPEWKMLPLLPTPPCAAAIAIPAPSPPKPSRADAVERWDACKSAPVKSPPKPSRADAVERWDACKTSSDGKDKSSSSSTGRASSCERWDVNKKSPTSFSSSSCRKWERTKRPVINRGSSSSAERWDAHKKPRLPQAGEDDGQSSTGSNDMEVDDKTQPQMGPYAGQGFFAVAPPEPTMLPVPSFLVLPRFIAA
jgi:hypothetical protein